VTFISNQMADGIWLNALKGRREGKQFRLKVLEHRDVLTEGEIDVMIDALQGGPSYPRRNGNSVPDAEARTVWSRLDVGGSICADSILLHALSQMRALKPIRR